MMVTMMIIMIIIIIIIIIMIQSWPQEAELIKINERITF